MAWFENSWSGSAQAPSEQAYLGNGVLGWRLGPNPLESTGRCFVSGFAGRDPQQGVSRLIELPGPLGIAIEFGTGNMQVAVESQKLDFRASALYTRMRLRDSDGRGALVETRNVAYRNVPSLLGIRITVTPDRPGAMVMRATVARPAGGCTIEKAAASAPPSLRRVEADLRIAWRSSGGESRCGAAAIPVVDPGAPRPAFQATASEVAAGADTLLLRWDDLPSGAPLPVDWVVALVSDLYHPAPFDQAARLAQWGAVALGPGELFEAHCGRWAQIWRARPIVDSDDNTQRAVDGSMFYLHSSVHRSSRQSMAPFGLSGNGYNGHVFWDCETWTYPPVLLQNPGAARSILEFRLGGLEHARKNAALFGFDGAMFPWEAAIDGSEDTPLRAATGFLEHHITPDIAYAFWQYQCATRDSEFLHRATWPVLREVARWIVSRAEKTARGFEIRHVIPADEHSFNVNNSAHTNLVCKAALEAARACAALVGVEPPSAWAEVAANIVVPRGDDGMILQQDGWTTAHTSKQADTVLAIYPLAMIDNAEDIARVVDGHVKIDPSAACRVAMGDQINAVICARAQRTDLARMVWERGWKPYWIEPWGMFAESARGQPGCFVTGCGGLMQAALIGFPGLQLDRPDVACHEVAMPDGWKSITCECLFLNDKPHRLIAEPGMERARIEPVVA